MFSTTIIIKITATANTTSKENNIAICISINQFDTT